MPGQAHKLLIAVVHLQPLPGAPGAGPIADTVRRALTEAGVLLDAGFDALIVENFGDAPFFPDRVPPITVAAMTRVVSELSGAFPSARLGVNVLRNDAAAALSVAAVTGADFIRVNVHSGLAYADQGTLEGRAHETLRLRDSLRAGAAIYADVGVKHATFPPGFDIVEAAKDTFHRGRADALIVTGGRTGGEADLDVAASIKSALPKCTLLVGSGVTPKSVKDVLGVVDGVIVGSALKHGGVVTEAVDAERARGFIAAARG